MDLTKYDPSVIRKALYDEIVKSLPEDANPLVHGSVYFQVERETSDLDISLETGYNLALVEEIFTNKWEDVSFKYIKVRNGKAVLRMFLKGVNWWVDFSPFRPTAYKSRNELLECLNYQGVRKIYNSIRDKALGVFSYNGLTNYRLIWLLYLWTVFRPEDEIVKKNFAKFLQNSLFVRYVFASGDDRIMTYSCNNLSLIVDGEDVIIPNHYTYSSVYSLGLFLMGRKDYLNPHLWKWNIKHKRFKHTKQTRATTNNQ